MGVDEDEADLERRDGPELWRPPRMPESELQFARRPTVK